MKKLLVLLTALAVLVACGEKAPADGTTKLFNDLYAKVESITLTDQYADLKATSNKIQILVVETTFINRGSKEENIGGSYAEIVIDGDVENTYRAELMSGSDNAFRLHEKLESEDSKTAEFIFGIPTDIDGKTVELKINDILYTTSGSLEIDLIKAKKDVASNLTNKNDDKKDDKKDTKKDDKKEDKKEDKPASSGSVSSNWMDLQFALDGDVFTLPAPFSQFEALGYKLRKPGEFIINPKQGVYGNSLYLDDNIVIATSYHNPTDAAVDITESNVISVNLQIPYGTDVNSYQVSDFDVELPGGLRLTSSKDDVLAVLGEPKSTYGDDPDHYESMIFQDADRNFKLDLIFKENKLYSYSLTLQRP